MRKKPIRQGRLDGLCGVYSVINAVNVLAAPNVFTWEQRHELFELLVKAVFDRQVGNRKNVRFLWNGTWRPDVQEMLKVAARFARKRLGFGLKVKVGLPGSGVGKKIPTFWKTLDAELSARRGGGGAAIVGFQDDTMSHWTCVVAVKDKSLKLRDSCGIKYLKKLGGTLGPQIQGKRRFEWKGVFILTRED